MATATAAALHQLNGVLHLHLVVEGDELWLLGALARNQALLHVLLVEAVHPEGQERQIDRWKGGRRGGVYNPFIDLDQGYHVAITHAMVEEHQFHKNK